MDFNLPADLTAYLDELDRFIAREIKPLEEADDNIRFFDHRREWARTDFDNGGLPRHEWEALLRKAKNLADAAGHLRFAIPKLWRQGRFQPLDGCHPRAFRFKGLGLHNDLQNEHSIVGNLPIVTMLDRYGTDDQKAMIDGSITGKYRITFGLTEPITVPTRRTWKPQPSRQPATTSRAGSSTARRCGPPACTSPPIARCSPARRAMTATRAASPACWCRPRALGVKVEEYMWTFNMPTDHPASASPTCSCRGCAVRRGRPRLSLAQCFVHENRIRQAASSLGAAVYCIEESVKYARERKPFGKALAENQAIQWPLVELATQAEMLRLLIRKTAWEMDQLTQAQVEHTLSDRVSMCNFWANRLCCEAADRAMQVHGGMGYSRHKPFEHIYRHHRRYRITEGSEEIQKRRIAGFLFGYEAGKH